MRKIVFFITGAFLFQQATAQTIDRTKQPKPGPAPVISIADPVVYKLDNGITVLVVENHKLPKVTASYSIDAGPITEGSKAGGMSLMGQMLSEGTRTHAKAQFDDAVDQIGADVSLSSGGGSVSALTRYFDQAFALMTEAIKEPAFTQESFEKLKSQTLTGLKANERSVKAIAGRVSNALLYGKDHPNGEFETAASVTALTLDDIKAFYAKYITPSRGILTFVGDIKPEQAKALAEKAFKGWKGAALQFNQVPPVKNPATTEINLVDVPNAVQSEIKVANLVQLPMSSPDYFAVLLANQILGGGAESYLFMDLREKHGFTYGAYSSIASGRNQTVFSASASVRNEKTDSAVVAFIDELKRICTEKVTTEELNSAKAIYNGSFALGMENNARIATFASNILLNNLPKDFYRTYLQKINAVTPDDVLRAAKKYFTYGQARIIVTGKADLVQGGLARLGYPVHQFTKEADPVTAAATTTKAAAAATPQAVVTDYLKAIGGLDEIKKLSSIAEKMSMSMQGMTIDVVHKAMAPNKQLVLATMGGNTVNKQVFDGVKGYAMQQGNKVDLPADEVKAQLAQTSIVEQVDYLGTAGFKLESKGVEKVSGKDAYKIQVTKPGGKVTFEYYDVATKLLLRNEESMEQNGMSITKSTDYADYKKVGNLLFPYKTSLTFEAGGQQQTMELTASEIKLNEGVTADDFK
ncbi:M16 family metallopeptidase [Deminuibacter soli]|uniref:Insulinase family protein n=1 Tax=Deminuibacter soli TaxID=2291815 RepID=A0A3E1NFE2_9BACT|nr:insulinase family protein [Deminuibacter soli]RFM26690.1 insulinase family protein [Deminuibacter soli]